MSDVTQSQSGTYQLQCFSPGVRVLFSTRQYSNARHPQFLLDHKIDPQQFFRVRQIHSSTVVDIEDSSFNVRDVEADALVTGNSSLSLGILTADCIPVFYWEPVSQMIALAHAGWKGLYGGILEKTVQRMVVRRAKPQNIQVAFGPSIRLCCYEVGREFLNLFPNRSTIREGRVFMNLIEEAKDRLMSQGIMKTHLYDTGICTSCRNDQFFSARREKTSERILSIIQIL